jgi:hypothetical protein
MTWASAGWPVGAAYEAISQSRLLPDLDIALLERCVGSVHGSMPVARFAPASGGNH